MNKNNLLIFTIISSIIGAAFISPTLAASPTPNPTSTPASEELTENLSSQINDLKEKIASRVAQLDLVEKRGILGTVTDVKGMQISITDAQGKEHLVEVDEITKFSSSSQSNFGMSDIEKNDKLSIIGLYNKDSERILARFVKTTTIPLFISGGISSIDDKNFVVTVTTPDEKEYKVDIENVTKTLSFTKDNLDTPKKVGFSTLERGVRVSVVGYPDTKEKNRITATRLLLFTDLPKNPKIVITDQAVDTENVVTSSGSAKKLTPLR